MNYSPAADSDAVSFENEFEIVFDGASDEEAEAAAEDIGLVAGASSDSEEEQAFRLGEYLGLKRLCAVSAVWKTTTSKTSRDTRPTSLERFFEY